MSHAVISAHSSNSESGAAAREIATRLGQVSPRLVVFFHSSNHDGAVISRELEAQLPEAHVLGCSSSGEFSDASYGEKGVVALGFGGGKVLRVASALAPLEGDVHSAISEAGQKLSAQLGTPLRELDPQRFIGIVLVDGVKQQEERVNEALGNLAPQFSFVGGSAGDLLASGTTWVHGARESSPFGVALAVLELDAPFKVLKTCSYVPTEKVLVVTRIQGRLVLELDGRPAAQAYADAIGVPVEKLDTGAFLFSPLGLIIDGKPWLRSMAQTTPDGGILFACEMREGMRMHVMTPTDMVEDTKRALEEARRELGRPFAGALLFNCLYRKLELQARGNSADYARVFKDFPAAGLHTHGESWLGHMNQTLTGLVFS